MRSEDYTWFGAPHGAIRLVAPLGFRWALRRGGGIPVVKGGSVIAFQGERRTLVCLDGDGRLRWRLPGEAGMCAIVGDEAVSSVERAGHLSLFFLDVATGQLRRQEPLGDSHVVAVLAGGDHFIARSWPDSCLSLRSLSGGLPTVWSRTFGTPDQVTMDLGVASDSTCCILMLTARDTSNAKVLALRLDTGEDLWSVPLDDIDAPAERDWDPVISGDIVVINTENGMAALDKHDGRLVWKTGVLGVRTVYGGSVYVCRLDRDAPGEPSRIITLDLRDGRERWRRSYPEVLKKARANRLQGYPVVSETHIFSGDCVGYVWAFDNKTGDPGLAPSCQRV